MDRHYTVDNPKQLQIERGRISIQSCFSKKDLGLVQPSPNIKDKLDNIGSITLGIGLSLYFQFSILNLYGFGIEEFCDFLRTSKPFYIVSPSSRSTLGHQMKQSKSEDDRLSFLFVQQHHSRVCRHLQNLWNLNNQLQE